MRSDFGDRIRSGLSAALVSTALRCHVWGASLSIALILVTAWVWFLGHAAVATVVCGDDEIDLGEAIALLENQNQWRMLSKVGYEEQDQLNTRTREITRWLPERVDFKTVEAALLDLGEDTQLHLFSIQQGEREVGQRVAVLNVSCVVQGSFTALCRFLNQLPLLAQPMDCNELTLHRESEERALSYGLQGLVGGQACRATLNLRIPYSASGTAVWDLLKESGDAT